MRSSIIGRCAQSTSTISNSNFFLLSEEWCCAQANGEKMLSENVNGIATKFVVFFLLLLLFVRHHHHIHRTETGRKQHKNFCRNSCNFKRFILFLCYYVLLVFMYYCLCRHRLFYFFFIVFMISAVVSHTQYTPPHSVCLYVLETWWHSL